MLRLVGAGGVESGSGGGSAGDRAPAGLETPVGGQRRAESGSLD